MTGFVAGFFAPWIIYAFMLLLHLVLPARKVDGYVHGRVHRQAAQVPAQRTAGAGGRGGSVGGARRHRRSRLGLALHSPLVGPDRFLRAGGALQPGVGAACPAHRAFAGGRPLLRAPAEPAVLAAGAWTPRCSCI